MEAPQRGRRERGRRRSGKAPRSSIPPEGPSLRAVWAPRASPPPGSRPPLYECGWALARLHWSSQGLRDRRSRDDIARSSVARRPLAPARRAPETRWLMSNFRSGGITIRPGVLQFALVGGNSATRCPADRGTGGPAPPFRGPGGGAGPRAPIWDHFGNFRKWDPWGPGKKGAPSPKYQNLVLFLKPETHPTRSAPKFRAESNPQCLKPKQEVRVVTQNHAFPRPPPRGS